MAELCKEFELPPTQINDWKRQLLDRAATCSAIARHLCRWNWRHCMPRLANWP